MYVGNVLEIIVSQGCTSINNNYVYVMNDVIVENLIALLHDNVRNLLIY